MPRLLTSESVIGVFFFFFFFSRVSVISYWGVCLHCNSSILLFPSQRVTADVMQTPESRMSTADIPDAPARRRRARLQERRTGESAQAQTSRRTSAGARVSMRP